MISVIMEFASWAIDFLFSKRKNYVGTHWTSTVDIVPPEYHPLPECCAYPALWEARVSGRVDYLRVPLKVFYALNRVGREIDKAVMLSNYRWADVPLSEWPEGWRAQNG